MKSLNKSPYDVIAAIRNKGITSTALSKQLSPSGDTSAVGKALRRPWPRMNKAIAEFLGVSLHHLWPEWYAPDGSLIHARSRKKRSTTGHFKERLSERAA